jgi:DNA-directed RNA polymerase specialized sigma subunit
LIDEIQTEIRDKNILSESFDELMNDFKEEFAVEYIELGREPSRSDIQDYLGIPIIVQNVNDEEKYYLLTKI